MQKNVTGQKITVFAFDATTNLPKTGDAANLTAYVDKDDAGVNVLADTSATEKDATNARGYYIFDVAQAESNADKLLFTCKSATANVVVICCPDVVYTDPANFTALSINGSGLVVTSAGTMTLTTTTTNLTNNTPTAGTLTLNNDKSGYSGVMTAGTLTLNNDKTGYSITSGTVTTGTINLTNTATNLTNQPTITAGTITLVNTTTNLTNNVPTSGTITLAQTATALTNLPSIPPNWLTSTGIAAAALNGKGDWMVSYSQPTGFLAATFPGGTVASTTNITAGTIATVTNLTNAPTAGDFTAAMKASITAAVPTAASVAALILVTPAQKIVTDSSGFVTFSNTISFPNATLAASQPNYAPSKAGDAMTLTNAYDAAKTAAQAGDAMALTPSERSTLAEVFLEADIAAAGTNSGSTAAAILAAGSVGDPWSTVLPGAYADGTAGNIVGNNLDAAVSTRLATTDYTAPDNAGIGSAAASAATAAAQATTAATQATAGATSAAAVKTKTDHLPDEDMVNTAGKLWVLDSNGNATPTAADNREEMDSNSTRLAAINATTAKVETTLEADTGTRSRLTTASLVNAPSGSGGGSSAAEIWAHGNRTLTGPGRQVVESRAGEPILLVKNEGRTVANGTAISIVKPANAGYWPPDLTGLDIVLALKPNPQVKSVAVPVASLGTCTVITPTGAEQCIQLEITPEQAAVLVAGINVYTSQVWVNDTASMIQEAPVTALDDVRS